MATKTKKAPPNKKAAAKAAPKKRAPAKAAAPSPAPPAAPELVRLDAAGFPKSGKLHRGPWQPRRRFDPDAHAELVASVKAGGGNHSPILVRPMNTPNMAGHFSIVFGERRARACAEAGVPVLAMVRDMSDAEALELAGRENLDRDDLTVLDEARWLEAMVKADGKPGAQRRLADRLERSEGWISNRLRLLELPVEVLQLVEDDLVDHTAARDLLLPFLKLRDDKVRAHLFGGIVKALRKQEKAKGSKRRSVLEIINGAAAALSWPIPGSARFYGVDDKKGWPKFSNKAHDKCTCGAPPFPYNSYGNENAPKTVRCFDGDWWRQQQDAAEAAEKAAAERAKAGADAKTRKLLDSGNAPALLTPAQLSAAANKAGVNSWLIPHRIGESYLVDPSLLADVPLIVVAEGDGHRVTTLDVKGLKRAAEAAEKELDALRERIESERADADRKLVEGRPLEPWVCAELLKPGRYNDVRDVADELGMSDPPHELPESELLVLVKVCAERSRRGDFDADEGPYEHARAELEKRLKPQLDALIASTIKAATAAAKPTKKKGGKES